MSFLDFIFDNLFIVIIIVFGLVNFFNSFAKKGSNEQRSRESNPTQQSQKRAAAPQETQPKRHVLGRMAEQFEQKIDELANQFENHDHKQTAKKTQESLRNTQQKQYDRLRQEIKEQSADSINSGEHKAFQSIKKPSASTNHHEEPFDVNKKLTKKGLVEGIIMAEVLGPPRAIKPYQSIIHQRRR